jgi:poly-gamma-glutamate capsule biosynthesis protein CapA/YwtB (metallophosphatase superfamily)
MAHFIYGVATNTGKGFFTANDRRAFFLRGYPADVWMVGNNVNGASWLAEKNGVEKTKSEAQALITAEIEAAQADYDALSAEEKAARPGGRPADVTLP